MGDEGVSLSDDYIFELIEEAATNYRRYQSIGPRGQLMMPSDGLDWWIVRTTWDAATEELTALRADLARLREAALGYLLHSNNGHYRDSAGLRPGASPSAEDLRAALGSDQ